MKWFMFNNRAKAVKHCNERERERLTTTRFSGNEMEREEVVDDDIVGLKSENRNG